MTQARTESVAGLDASQSELDAIEKKLTVNHDQLSYEYRELNDHIRNKENKESAVTRETIRQLKIERKLLWEQQDSAESMIAMHQADVAAAESHLRLLEMKASENPNAQRIRQLEKQFQKAQAKAQRLHINRPKPAS